MTFAPTKTSLQRSCDEGSHIPGVVNVLCSSNGCFPSTEIYNERNLKNRPDRATMRPDCVSACIEFSAKHVTHIETDG